ncbi:hypothetical protein IE53DRAFT_317301 [Violaceomyces palustris]|uniref:Uncharacterized protein n=1 Tax=Violaceomyces palustris TaxID=1673888 RepID=A0ACD0NV10_9BASI|nr:hypothetical protein IE53DRAFT_317301 [Violaceomyces palustris]
MATSVSTPPVSVPQSRRPKMKLSLSSEQRADFSAAVQASQQQFTSDTSHLPKSTNMGMSASAAAAAMSTNPFNHSALSPHSWEEDETEEETKRVRESLKAKQQQQQKATFLKAVPAVFVSSIESALPFYKEMLSFTTIGKPDSYQAKLRRAPATTSSPASPVGYKRPMNGLTQACPPVAIDEGVRIVLRVRPKEWGEFNAEGNGPPQLWIVVGDVDELFRELVARDEQLRPKGDNYFPEFNFGKARIMGKPQNKAWGTRELIVLDSDGNKIVFYHEL